MAGRTIQPSLATIHQLLPPISIAVFGIVPDAVGTLKAQVYTGTSTQWAHGARVTRGREHTGDGERGGTTNTRGMRGMQQAQRDTIRGPG